jgi:hypothetical protein
VFGGEGDWWLSWQENIDQQNERDSKGVAQSSVKTIHCPVLDRWTRENCVFSLRGGYVKEQQKILREKVKGNKRVKSKRGSHFSFLGSSSTSS